MRIRKARFGFPELKTLNKMGYRDVARRMNGSRITRMVTHVNLTIRYLRGFAARILRYVVKPFYPGGISEALMDLMRKAVEEQEGENIRNNVIAF